MLWANFYLRWLAVNKWMMSIKRVKDSYHFNLLLIVLIFMLILMMSVMTALFLMTCAIDQCLTLFGSP